MLNLKWKVGFILKYTSEKSNSRYRFIFNEKKLFHKDLKFYNKNLNISYVYTSIYISCRKVVFSSSPFFFVNRVSLMWSQINHISQDLA